MNSPPWLIPFIALSVWNRLWRSSKEELTKTEAIVIGALWQNRNGENKIPEATGLEHTNEVRSSMGLQPLLTSEFDVAVNRLMEMQCIEMNHGVIWLRGAA